MLSPHCRWSFLRNASAKVLRLCVIKPRQDIGDIAITPWHSFWRGTCKFVRCEFIRCFQVIDTSSIQVPVDLLYWISGSCLYYRSIIVAPLLAFSLCRSKMKGSLSWRGKRVWLCDAASIDLSISNYWICFKTEVIRSTAFYLNCKVFVTVTILKVMEKCIE